MRAPKVSKKNAAYQTQDPSFFARKILNFFEMFLWEESVYKQCKIRMYKKGILSYVKSHCYPYQNASLNLFNHEFSWILN